MLCNRLPSNANSPSLRLNVKLKNKKKLVSNIAPLCDRSLNTICRKSKPLLELKITNTTKRTSRGTNTKPVGTSLSGQLRQLRTRTLPRLILKSASGSQVVCLSKEVSFVVFPTDILVLGVESGDNSTTWSSDPEESDEEPSEDEVPLAQGGGRSQAATVSFPPLITYAAYIDIDLNVLVLCIVNHACWLSSPSS